MSSTEQLALPQWTTCLKHRRFFNLDVIIQAPVRVVSVSVLSTPSCHEGKKIKRKLEILRARNILDVYGVAVITSGSLSGDGIRNELNLSSCSPFWDKEGMGPVVVYAYGIAFVLNPVQSFPQPVATILVVLTPASETPGCNCCLCRYE